MILCDIMMPLLDGYSVLEAVRKDDGLKSTPFIFFTAYSETGEIEKGLHLGANDFVVKPFDCDVLVNKIEKFLR